MGLLSRLVFGVLAIVLLLAAVAFAAWAIDYGIEATVEHKQCNPPPTFGVDPKSSQLSVKTKLLGIDHDVKGITFNACAAVQNGNFVIYHLKSGRTSLYQSEGGTCVYDSVGGVGGCS